jgi:hypothetical protein
VTTVPFAMGAAGNMSCGCTAAKLADAVNASKLAPNQRVCDNTRANGQVLVEAIETAVLQSLSGVVGKAGMKQMGLWSDEPDQVYAVIDRRPAGP